MSPLSGHRELGVLQAAGLRWVSLQEDDARYVLTPANRAGLLDSVRRYVVAEGLQPPEKRVVALRAVTIDLLT